MTVALGAVTAAAGSSSSAVAAGTLVTVLVGVIAQFLKQSRESQDRTEILLAELEDARDEQARAAAIAERGRIASGLHDLIEHSLSGAAIQLQGARKLADREHATPRLSDAIDRTSELVKSGLANARQAVGALSRRRATNARSLPALIDSYETDMNLDVTLRIEGDARTLPADPSLALYRAAQEALTNVTRYAPSAAPPSTCATNPPARSFRSTTAPGPPDRDKEWAAATDSRACASELSEPAAQCRGFREAAASAMPGMVWAWLGRRVGRSGCLA